MKFKTCLAIPALDGSPTKTNVDSQNMIETALSQKLKKTKRNRSASFYFAPPEEEKNDMEHAFDSFDYNTEKSSVTPDRRRKRLPKAFSNQKGSEFKMNWTMQKEDKDKESESESSISPT